METLRATLPASGQKPAYTVRPTSNLPRLRRGAIVCTTEWTSTFTVSLTRRMKVLGFFSPHLMNGTSNFVEAWNWPLLAGPRDGARRATGIGHCVILTVQVENARDL